MMGSRALSIALLASVLALSVWSLWPGDSAELPGTLRFGLVDGAGTLSTEQAVRPLADYLGLAIRRSVRVIVFAEGEDTVRANACELLLLPASRRSEFPDYELLANAKGHGRVGQLPRATLVRRPDAAGTSRLIRGDRFSFLGDSGLADRLRELGFARALEDYPSGHDPYHHGEALASFAHGAFDAALVRDGDLADALADGLLRSDQLRIDPLGEREPAFVLLAKAGLRESLRMRLRRAALELDHLRLDEASLRVQNVISSLSLLGIDGFVPIEPFPELRP